jgi:hypothetical protein
LDVTQRNDMDFSIPISKVTAAVSGTYYCVTFQRTNFGDKEFKSGPGTKLSVHGEYSVGFLCPLGCGSR